MKLLASCKHEITHEWFADRKCCVPILDKTGTHKIGERILCPDCKKKYRQETDEFKKT
jgi:hypothetical protein|tara:strand:- start:3024 stop:3197 length:174 start_codon:yes stop_codon:yes gene_type:complete